MYFTFNDVMGVYKDQVLGKHYNAISRLMKITEIQFNQLDNIALQISFDKTLQLNNKEDNPIKMRTIKDQLMVYKMANTFIDEIVFYYRNDTVLYTSEYTTQLKNFMRYYYPYQNWDYNDFYNDINIVNSHVIRPAEAVKYSDENIRKKITFIYPISNRQGEQYGTLMFLIDEEAVLALIKEEIKSDTTLFILDSNNDIVATTNNESYLANHEFLTILDHISNNQGEQIEIKGQPHYISYINDDSRKWRVVSISTYESVMKEVSELRDSFFSLLLVIMSVAGVIISYIMYLNYNPIKQLKQHATLLSNEHEENKDELEVIHKALDILTNRNQLLNTKLISSNPIKKDKFLFLLLKGEVPVNELEVRGREVGIIYTNKYYGACIIRFDNVENGSSIGSMDIESILPDTLEGYIKERVESLEFVLIYSVNSKKDDKHLFDELHNNIKNKWEATVTMGVGDCYDELSLIPKSYLAACDAIGYGFIKGCGEVIYNNELINKEQLIRHYPNELIEDICKAVCYAKREETVILNNTLKMTVKEQGIPLFILRGIFCDLISRIHNYAEQNDVEIKNKSINVFTIESLSSIDELLKLVSEVTINLCHAFDKEDDEVSFSAKMKDYIDKNVGNTNFSISQMADNFSVSFSYISRHFKEQFDVTPQEYLQTLRVEKAKDLLVNTNMNLKDIAMEVGYSNVSSFIRCFKRYEETTPGQFRNKKGV